MGAQKSGHHEPHAGDDTLLHLIARKERELEALLTAARTEAGSIDAKARSEAEQMLSDARAQAAATSREQEQRVAGEVARINGELQARAAREVETLRRHAAAGQAEAVRLVVDRVIKGTPG